MRQELSYRVGILTTAGIVWVEKIEPVSFLPVSQAVVAGDFRQIDMSAGYNALVSTLLPRYGVTGNFRLTLSSDIETGRSWELPVFLAHLLFHADQLATDQHDETSDDPAQIVFATGALGADLQILEDDYFIEKKLKSLSPEQLMNATILVPHDQKLDEAREATQSIASVDDAWQIFTDTDQKPLDTQECQTKSPPKPPQLTTKIALGLASLALVLIVWFWLQIPKSVNFEQLGAKAVYAEDQDSCFDWLMGVPNSVTEVSLTNPNGVQHQDICGISFDFGSWETNQSLSIKMNQPRLVYAGFASAFERGVKWDARNPVVKLPLRQEMLNSDFELTVSRHNSDELSLGIELIHGEP